LGNAPVQAAIIRGLPEAPALPLIRGRKVGASRMARDRKRDRRRIGIALAALAWLAACSQPQKHNSAENEFNAWANQMEHASPNGQATAPDFEEPANVMERVTPANTQ
jgi:hypothetical protein